MKTVEMVCSDTSLEPFFFFFLEAIDEYRLMENERFQEELTVLMSTMPCVKFALVACLNEASKGRFICTFMLHFLDKECLLCCYEHTGLISNFYLQCYECFTPGPKLTAHTEEKKKKKTYLVCLLRCLKTCHSQMSLLSNVPNETSLHLFVELDDFASYIIFCFLAPVKIIARIRYESAGSLS